MTDVDVRQKEIRRLLWKNAFMHEKYPEVQKSIFHMKSVVAIIREVLYSILLRRAAEMLDDFLMFCLS